MMTPGAGNFVGVGPVLGEDDDVGKEAGSGGGAGSPVIADAAAATRAAVG